MKPHIHVACAIIEHDGMILAAQRSETMRMPLKWEFPGGKLESGETPETCLVREVREELAIGISLVRALPVTTHSYETFTVTLYPFVCAPAGGVMTLYEHRAVAWMEPEQMFALDWAEADLPIIAGYLATRDPGTERGART
ncbi:MAG: (deoxy)nucleoside triphosphate pyrophosphohydrolase [Oryzomonas sp.]|uniref:(deoxy)nucleoside triphosphate pyrophosphohydrolase n=1 Tax=Oryzomonas sp. TaxID=2855186 RepID=UPI00283DCF00|nr:(deoxy)nucleoside triphosphate pyrophosphohydrolase [Oryzomonas sp.]MDR3579852.1 (deoxy)nucleoside triphosphate pyrophosphohydrolase [Oryzomonas sp.]